MASSTVRILILGDEGVGETVKTKATIMWLIVLLLDYRLLRQRGICA